MCKLQWKSKVLFSVILVAISFTASACGESSEKNVQAPKDAIKVTVGSVQQLDIKEQPAIKTEAAGNCTYKNIMAIKVNVNNELLKNIIKNNWEINSPEKIIGKPDVYFNTYDVYSTEGISIKHSEQKDKEGYTRLTGKIFNVLLDSSYTDNIVSNISLKSSTDDIVKVLGEPHFKDGGEQVYGYKTEDFYIFFLGGKTLKEIS